MQDLARDAGCRVAVFATDDGRHRARRAGGARRGDGARRAHRLREPGRATSTAARSSRTSPWTRRWPPRWRCSRCEELQPEPVRTDAKSQQRQRRSPRRRPPRPLRGARQPPPLGPPGGQRWCSSAGRATRRARRWARFLRPLQRAGREARSWGSPPPRSDPAGSAREWMKDFARAGAHNVEIPVIDRRDLAQDRRVAEMMAGRGRDLLRRRRTRCTWWPRWAARAWTAPSARRTPAGPRSAAPARAPRRSPRPSWPAASPTSTARCRTSTWAPASGCWGSAP